MAAGAGDVDDAAQPAGGPVLLFDGVCALCNWTVRVLLRLDRRGILRFAPLEGDFAAGVLERHPELRSVDSLVLVANAGDPLREQALVKSDAVLALTRHLGGAWRLLRILTLLPRALRDWGYDLIARHRYRIFGRFGERPPRPVNAAGRFLE